MTKFKILVETVLKLSSNSVFIVAVSEWDLVGIEKNEDWGSCACSHDIINEFYIKNKITGGELIVGSCCVKHFDPEIVKLSDVLKNQKLNKFIIEYAKLKGWITSTEYNFLKYTITKRRLHGKTFQSLQNRILDILKISTNAHTRLNRNVARR